MKIAKQVKKYVRWTLIILLVSQVPACSFVNELTNTGAARNTVQPSPHTQSAKNNHANPSSYVVHGKRYYVLKSTKGYDKTGYASWYGSKFHGQHTSSDEAYNMYSMTGASTTLPIPSYVRVTNLANNSSVVVKINDRGPFRSDRIIDLSYGAAKKLGFAGSGTAHVRVTALDSGNDASSSFFADNSSENITPEPVKKHSVQLADNSIRVKAKETKVKAGKNKPQYLQVGSYKSHSKAVGVSKQLASLTKTKVAVKEAYRNHAKVYRVNIGPLAENSNQVKKILATHGFEDYIITNS